MRRGQFSVLEDPYFTSSGGGKPLPYMIKYSVNFGGVGFISARAPNLRVIY